MSEVETMHPSLQQLAAFGLGQLDQPASAEVERHVAACDTCCEKLRTLPGDTLVALVRQAGSVPGIDAAATSGQAIPSNPAQTELPADLVRHPRYRLTGLLGTGGMGAVYKAEHQFMERRVALKVINQHLTHKPAVVERFRREVKAAARLTHPNIVTAYDAEQAGDTHFLVMEFVEGTNLARVVEERGPLPVAEACEYIRQAALGLQHAWEHGMVHRDIKPHNLMLAPQGKIKILDFGLARLASEISTAASEPAAHTPPGEGASSTQTEAGIAAAAAPVTGSGVVLGTVDYIAPEQVADPHVADIRADIYSLGCTLYFLLRGHCPFPEGTVMQKLKSHAERMPQLLSEFRRDVPAELERVLSRMMAKDPGQRYQTPGEAAQELILFVNEIASTAWRLHTRPIMRMRGNRAFSSG